MAKFNELGLGNDILEAIGQMGFEEATPIQAQSIPLSLQGTDVIGQAQTGTGKTAAFGVPMIEKTLEKHPGIAGLVVAPTRELAMQVAEELNKIGRFKNIRALPIYGGQDIQRQIRALKKRPQIVVGTPGRLLDHIKRKTLRLQKLHTVVLDEADEMLNMGFIEDIEAILKEVPEERQTLLFSATMPDPIRRIAEKFMKDPETVRVKAKEVTVPNITQNFIEVDERKKFDAFTRLLDMENPDLAIVFGRTKRRVDELSEALASRGYSAEGIHGDLTQSKRTSVMKQFKNRSIEVLVATDVAARGLDVSGVTHVYNFDIPQDPESYVHRIGRTGRAGKTGVAYTFVTPREMGQLKNIERLTKRKMTRKPVPTTTEALENQQRSTIDRIKETAAESNLNDYTALAEQLLEDHDSVTLLAAAVKLLTKEPDQTPVQLTAEAPVVSRKNFRDKRRGGGQNRQKQYRGGKSDFRRRRGGQGGHSNKRSNYRDSKHSSNE
ncbi:DEAD/DEAH box helicase [Bacillaceae bacterium SIJ1]|uniref:DEAD/DEAH box helicase n=1 Tax=Litoribacterium kuwaitense TaxID=1398745 RepID=UPI0013EDFB96|nr:DEAD/DEAH box helicase [Litoribacterium kuwaitense]NGP46258.1 DEAD/DEAH box helicase [Litoribacterium kuwaitense]